MAKVKKNLKHERFENSNFYISYDINYDKKMVSCMLEPKQDFLSSINRRANNAFIGNDKFGLSADLITSQTYITVVEDDPQYEFNVDVCKAQAYYNAVEMLNNDWHNDTLKMQKLIASKVLDASRVYTSYSSIMLKRAKDRLEKKTASAEAVETDFIAESSVAENSVTENSDSNSVTEKLKSAAKLCKKLFTK